MLVLTNGKHPIRMIENIRKITAKESRKMSNHIETKCIHGNLDFSWDEPTKAVSFPIYQTATFGHIGLGHSTGFDYTREKNPTRQHLDGIFFRHGGGDSSI